jgi:hypothetical protein
VPKPQFNGSGSAWHTLLTPANSVILPKVRLLPNDQTFHFAISLVRATVRKQIASLDPELPVSAVLTMDQMIADSLVDGVRPALFGPGVGLLLSIGNPHLSIDAFRSEAF